MSAPEIIHQLVERFNENILADHEEGYNEASLRREFLGPMFEALGWDVTNRQGCAEQYKEVIYEPSIAIDGERKAPDYCFRIGKENKFFVEAKKPSFNNREGMSPVYQLRRYAWSRDAKHNPRRACWIR